MIALQTDSLINGFVKRSKDILRDNLVGVYLHGSLAMGCFNPQKSDIDLIIVIDRHLSDSDKKAFMEMTVEYNALGPAKGIEMSIVLREVCKPFIYPTPYELHFSAGHLDWYRNDPDDYIRRMNGTDKDLAAHFTIINKRGRCLYGAQIQDMFAEVPSGDYMDSIWHDIEGAAEEITKYPMYLTLNLARVLAYKKEGLVLSKKEGGEWALEHMPAEYHSLITDAMCEYSKGADIAYDDVLAKRYAEYVLTKLTYLIRQAVAADEKRICELYVEMLQTIYCKEEVEGYKTGELDKFWAGDENRIFVAEDENVIGFLSVEVYHENEDYIYLNDFAVTEDYRNKGIGSALLKTAEAYAREINTPKICLHVEKTNLSAMRFYEKAGYAVYRDDGHRFLMNKELSSN